MSVWAILLVVVGGLLALALMLLGIPPLVYRLTRGPLERRVREHHAAGDVLRTDYRASFFGVTSQGMTQFRGLGVLVLAKDGLHFHMLSPSRDLSIPLADIRGTEVVRSHLGKTVGRKLLKVVFVQDGADDSVAWWVQDPEGWRTRIAELPSAR